MITERKYKNIWYIYFNLSTKINNNAQLEKEIVINKKEIKSIDKIINEKAAELIKKIIHYV